MPPQHCCGAAFISSADCCSVLVTGSLPQHPAPLPISRTRAGDHSYSDRCVPTRSQWDPALAGIILFYLPSAGRGVTSHRLSLSRRHMVFRMERLLQTGACDRQERLAQEPWASALTHRVTAHYHLALVSKQYSSLNCGSAHSCCHTCSLLSH